MVSFPSSLEECIGKIYTDIGQELMMLTRTLLLYCSHVTSRRTEASLAEQEKHTRTVNFPLRNYINSDIIDTFSPASVIWGERTVVNDGERT
jgi:hypothetical protein